MPAAMLWLKLLLVPGLLLATSLAGRRWGPRVAGRLAGLPVVIGPILVVLTLQHGPAFGARAAFAALGGVAAVLAFNLVYAWRCRVRGWPQAWGAAACSWVLAVCALAAWQPGVAVSVVLGVGALWGAPRLFPPLAAAAAPRPLTAADLALRMAMGAALTLAITAASDRLGPLWSGLVTTFPVMTSVLAVASHRSQGPAFTGTLLRGMVTGMAGFAAFCIAFATALPLLGTGVSIAVAVAAALSTQLAVPGTASGLWRGVRARPAAAPQGPQVPGNGRNEPPSPSS